MEVEEEGEEGDTEDRRRKGSMGVRERERI